jgi:hypothetical protein
MLKKWVFVFLLSFCLNLFGQTDTLWHKKLKILPKSDTLILSKNSINPSFFEIYNNDNQRINSNNYEIDFKSSQLIFKQKLTDTLTIIYKEYPKFLTQKFELYSNNLIVPNDAKDANLYVIKPNILDVFKPFDGLSTTGSITRGIAFGNNQNASVRSNLDLQITGKLSEKVSIRAAIQDNDVPLQQGGYSQTLDQFDQVFIEIFSNQWNVRAGDLFLNNRNLKLLNFSKKLQGIATQFNFGTKEKKTIAEASVALSRGVYAKSEIKALEGNQGPYKLTGNNGELYVLIISGSERVFVNGNLLARGENNQYMIDYNAGEIIFTSLFPVNSEMRIVVEYQFSDRNYSRFTTYANAHHTQEKWNLGTYYYQENDLKNQTLQQNLSDAQKTILTNAGNNSDLMLAPSAFPEVYSENKILYKKTFLNGVEFFEYSNNPLDELYQVKFSNLGKNKGNYTLSNSQAISKIYQYVAPIAGILQGEFEPVIQLIAPEQLQILNFAGGFTPNNKTNLNFELGFSNYDKNLFSTKDDESNTGTAGLIHYNQTVFERKNKLDIFANIQFVNNDFKPVERLFNIEFDRDWNINSIQKTKQQLISSGFNWIIKDKGNILYSIDQLKYGTDFTGNRNIIQGNLKHKNWFFSSSTSLMNSKKNNSEALVFKNFNKILWQKNKYWTGILMKNETIEDQNLDTKIYDAKSQRFKEYQTFIGKGDSTKIFIELGFKHRINDSLRSNFIQKVNHSNTFYLKSRLLNSEKHSLSLFINYRTLDFVDKKEIKSLNTRVIHQIQFFKNLFQSNLTYETQSGTAPMQEFTYIAVEDGKGLFMWNDYNNNGLQELEEFEIAPFTDLAKYVKVFLPNQIFIQTHQKKFAYTLTWQPELWDSKHRYKKYFSVLFNQTSLNLDKKTIRNNNQFNINPLDFELENVLTQNFNFRNSLFYNKGKQQHSVLYNYIYNATVNFLQSGRQENLGNTHILQYLHRLKKDWLITTNLKTSISKFNSENYLDKNFNLINDQLEQKITYNFSQNISIETFFMYQNKKEILNNNSKLIQNQWGINTIYNKTQKFTFNAGFSLINNQFTGNSNSAVAFTMLEGLQPNKNMTWQVLLQRNITQYLDINLNYQGRKSETSPTIHIGSVQLRAYF